MENILLLQSPPPKFEDIHKTIFTKGALEFVSTLHRNFDAKIEQLYDNRHRRTIDLQSLPVLKFKQSPERNDKSWKITPLPTRLLNRHLDLGDVSASNRAHFVSALNEDVQGVQVDFDDGHCPTWRNQLLAYHNVNLAVNGQLQGAPMTITTCPLLMLRPRAWNMVEHNILLRKSFEKQIFKIYEYELNDNPNATINNRELNSFDEIYYKIKMCSSKLLPTTSSNKVDIPSEVSHSRPRLPKLELPIFDGCNKEFLLPDRNKYVNMEQHFLKSYMKLVVDTCHRRGAPATGGMAAKMLKPATDGTDSQSKEVISSILEAKLKEIDCGVDGFMVYDTRVVPHVNELWKKSGATPNQISRTFDIEITAQDLLKIPSGGVTMQGLKHNVAISILFIYYWLAGIGHFFYSGNIEDSATAEISRYQIWQWIRFSPPLEDEPTQKVTAQLVEQTASNFSAHAHKNLCRSNAERKRLTAARYMSLELFVARNPPEFITSYLNDNHKFRTLHNKALLSNL
ncbi:hypothetical protein K1T71_011807 [Dendrolimus kikuchii]|uniref:Uncharacterized protein n=1 Tax=Dendrolimus kikuchii TaxID=765133 RepID=A0ACC1CM49_9NEOP|nr:hypothetical protein K1T71_011807 [Dendrolimus kikuchii]